MVNLETLPTRGDIERLQEQMLTLPQVELPTVHHFAHGTYVREMHVKADTVLVGKVHKTEHIFVLLSGEMTLITDQGRMRVKAPWIAVAPPGLKRAGYAHEDSIVLNIHHSFERELEKLEDELVEPDPQSCFGPGNTLKVLK